MTQTAIAIALALKNELERDFLQAAGLSSRLHASAVYSLPQKCPLLWLNLNPGGDETTCVILSDDEIAQGKHEFFDGHGVTSAETAACLTALFPGNLSRVRSVQGSNVVWERSADSDQIDLRYAAKQAAPFLRRYIKYVEPELIVFGGISAWELFCRAHSAEVEEYGDVLMGPYRGRDVRLFLRATLAIPEIGTLKSAAILHPSKRRWREVLDSLRQAVAGIVLPEPLCSRGSSATKHHGFV